MEVEPSAGHDEEACDFCQMERMLGRLQQVVSMWPESNPTWPEYFSHVPIGDEEVHEVRYREARKEDATLPITLPNGHSYILLYWPHFGIRGVWFAWRTNE